jgi:hypothetical protein
MNRHERRRAQAQQVVRYSAADDRILRRDWAAYVPAPEIACKLDRSVSSIRVRVKRLKLRRSGPTTRVVAWAPDHLKAQLPKLGPKAFRAACYAWREQQRDAEKAEKAAALAAAAAKIDRQRGLTRDEKIKAMRDLGMTLQSIGDLLGLTRERVRQIISHQGLQGRPRRGKAGQGLVC